VESAFDGVEAVTESSKTLLLAVPSVLAELIVATGEAVDAAIADRGVSAKIASINLTN
tara:strand:- start:144 stop:317 length:174 start_codon:yes stop_codon:yes gene_type:complete